MSDATPPDTKALAAARARKNRRLAWILAAIAVVFYLIIRLRWSGHA